MLRQTFIKTEKVYIFALPKNCFVLASLWLYSIGQLEVRRPVQPPIRVPEYITVNSMGDEIQTYANSTWSCHACHKWPILPSVSDLMGTGVSNMAVLLTVLPPTRKRDCLAHQELSFSIFFWCQSQKLWQTCQSRLHFSFKTRSFDEFSEGFDRNRFFPVSKSNRKRSEDIKIGSPLIGGKNCQGKRMGLLVGKHRKESPWNWMSVKST